MPPPELRKISLDDTIARLERIRAASRFEPTYECLACLDTGWIPTAPGALSAEEARVAHVPAGYQHGGMARRCDCCTATVEQRLEAAGVEARHLSCSLANWRGELPDFETFGEPGGKTTLTLFGDRGTGKTHLAIAKLRMHISRGLDGMFVSVHAWLELVVKPAMDEGRSTAAEVRKLVEFPGLLVLDDAWAARSGAYNLETVELVIATRHAAQRLLCITTDQRGVGLASVAGRVWSRLQEGVLIQQLGEDQRGRGARE